MKVCFVMNQYRAFNNSHDWYDLKIVFILIDIFVFRNSVHVQNGNTGNTILTQEALLEN